MLTIFLVIIADINQIFPRIQRPSQLQTARSSCSCHCSTRRLTHACAPSSQGQQQIVIHSGGAGNDLATTRSKLQLQLLVDSAVTV